MSGLGLLAALVLMLGVGSGVMVFKHHVDEERERVVELRSELREAQLRAAQLRAELAYHSRPSYLAGFADGLGLVPATAAELAQLDDIERWSPPADGERDQWLVALPSGHRAVLMLRPEQGSRP